MINYSTSLLPKNVGVIDYININVNYSAQKNRIWNFVFGGNIKERMFTQTFTFDPNCQLPNGSSPPTIPITVINFRSPIQGYIVINNKNYGVSDNPKYINFKWNHVTCELTLHFNVPLCNRKEQYSSIYANLWLKDGASGWYVQCRRQNGKTYSNPNIAVTCNDKFSYLDLVGGIQWPRYKWIRSFGCESSNASNCGNKINKNPCQNEQCTTLFTNERCPYSGTNNNGPCQFSKK